MFWKLLLAHFLTDFPLQTDKILEWKYKNNLGLVLHSGIFLLCSFFLLFPFIIDPRVLGWIVFLSLSHYILDFGKKILVTKFKIDNLLTFILDQALHITLIFYVSSTLPKDLRRIVLPPFVNLFYRDSIFLYLNGFVLASCGFGIVLLYLIKWRYKEDSASFIRYEMRWGVFERAVVFSLVILKEWFYLLIPFILLIRGFVHPMRTLKAKENSFPYPEMALSTFMTITLGFVFRILT